MTDTALAPPVDVEALERLPLLDQIDALGLAWRKWRRLETVAIWTFGKALRTVRQGIPRREWPGVRHRIGINRETARRYMALADGYAEAQIVQKFATVDAALKALPPAKPEPEPAPAPAVLDAIVDGLPEVGPDYDAPAFGDGDDPEAVVEAVAAEDERDHPPAPVVVDEESEIRRLRRRHQEDVFTINAGLRREQALDRKNRDIREALLSAPGCPNCADALARFWSVARPKS